MLRRTPLYRAVQPQIISSGLQPDLHPLLSILWEAAENVVFFAGRVKRRPGNQLVFDAGVGDIRGLSQQFGTTGTRWIWVGLSEVVRRWYGPTSELIHAFATFRQDETGSYPATFTDFTHYGDWTIMNNGVDTPKIYKHGVGLSNYGNAKPCVRFIKKLSFVLALGTDARGTRVEWSDSANIEEWVASTTNNAGGMSFDDFDTPIRAGCNLGSQIAVYSEDQMGLATFVNQPYYFGQKTVLDGIGAVGKNAVTTDGKNNFGVGRNGVWWTDSNSYRYIDEGYLHDYLQENVNWAQKSKIFAVRNDFTGCFEFFFPMLESLDVSEGWSFDPRTGGWSPIPGGISLKDERRLFQYPLVGSLDDGMVLYDAADESVVTPLVLRTKPLLMQVQSGSAVDDVHIDSKVDEVELLCKKALNVQFRLGSSQEQAGTYEWSEWFDVDTTSRTYKIGASPPDGVYWKLDFRSTANVWELDLQGFLLFGQVEGTKR